MRTRPFQELIDRTRALRQPRYLITTVDGKTTGPYTAAELSAIANGSPGPGETFKVETIPLKPIE